MNDRFTDLSLDLETLGVEPGSVITQIGVAAFNADGKGPVVQDTFYIDPQDCLNLGMTVKWSTIAWWLEQSAEARKALVTPVTTSLAAGLQRTQRFIDTYMQPDFGVWGYGATFDVTLMEWAFRRLALSIPWGYRQVSCARTLHGEHAMYVERPASAREHVGGEDAAAQALLIQRCIARSNRP